MSNNISRRNFLKSLSVAAAATGIACQRLTNRVSGSGVFQALEDRVFFPYISSETNPSATPTPTVQPTQPPNPAGPIVADHTVVDKYQDIPQFYIDQIKKMWVDIPGESHSAAYRQGCEKLEALDSRFQVNVTEDGTPEGYTEQYLRISRATWGDLNNPTGWIYAYGEEDWYTNSLAIQRTKDHLTYCNTHNLEIAAMGFGWCWDMTWINPPGGGIDPVHQVRWAGASNKGIDGNKPWGLDADDYDLTGNRVCMDTYLDAMLQYVHHCQANKFPTKLFFTTGTVDDDWDASGEGGYQRYLKNEYIRSFVKAANDRFLFDYADILCWSDNGEQNTQTWTDFGGTTRTYPFIHDNNMLKFPIAHIGDNGTLRLGKALWWMLARMAGWDGESM